MAHVPKRYCPTKVLYNADGSENKDYHAVELVCLDAWQKRVDACSGQ